MIGIEHIEKEHSPEKEHIAYFSMEVGISKDIPTYSGGLGVLAGDTLKAFSDIGLPVVGITMLNEKGYFHQHINERDEQWEEEVRWDVEKWMTKLPNEVTIGLYDREIRIGVWKYELIGTDGDIVPVYFLDTNIEGNHEEDRKLTSYLYGGDRRYRLCQELVLGVGGLKMLESLGYNTIKKYHMNEGHAALLTIELLRRTTPENGVFNEAAIRQKCVFTTHTPVAAGHDRFDKELFHNVLGDFVPEQIMQKVCEGEKVNMTRIGLNLSGHINGVAKRHGEITKEMFPGFHIDAITNGIHTQTWANEHIKELFDNYIKGWKKDPYTLRNALGIPGQELWDAHHEAKKEFFAEINEQEGIAFDHRRFTIGFARRFTAYKRPDLLLHDVERLKAIAREVGDIQVIFAGKAHKNDTQGKEIITHIIQTAKKINAENGALKIIFLPRYDMTLSKKMVSGCDVWLNNPQRPYEASGTSGMKAALNGTPQISTLDGWWIEGHIEGVTGWRIGPTPKEEAFYHDESPDDEAEDLYTKLRNEIIPMYYGDPKAWRKIMKHCIAINGSFFNTYRMVQQYLSNTYSD